MTELPLSRTFFLPDAEATQQMGVQLGRVLSVGTVILLEGDLGSGKTTLVQGIGQGLEVPDRVDSPTFTLINEYLGGRLPLYHLDLYRLNPAEAADLYPEIYWEGVEKEPGIVAIEWAERLPYRPPAYLHLRLTYEAASGRQVTLMSVGESGLAAVVETIWVRG